MHIFHYRNNDSIYMKVWYLIYKATSYIKLYYDTYGRKDTRENSAIFLSEKNIQAIILKINPGLGFQN